MVAAAWDCHVKLLDAATLETLLEFPIWPGTPMDMTFDCTGNHLAIVGFPFEVDLWDMTTLREGLAKLGLAWDAPAK